MTCFILFKNIFTGRTFSFLAKGLKISDISIQREEHIIHDNDGENGKPDRNVDKH